MNTHYEIDGYEVVFTPWHSEYLNEDLVAICVFKDGQEMMHAGMTHVEPSEQAAREQVELMKTLGVMHNGARME